MLGGGPFAWTRDRGRSLLRAVVWPAACALATAMTALAAPGSAQPADDTQRRAVAQALFDEAQKLMSAGQYSVACIKLEEVVRLQPGKIGALLTLARCYEGEGKTASAWSRYKNAADSARVSGDARQAEAQKKVEDLENKLPRISITVAEKTAALVGLSVKRDGFDVSPAQWGSAIPVDPGEHRIEVTAPGKTPWTTTATLTDARTTTVQVPELEVAGAATTPKHPPTTPKVGPTAIGSAGATGTASTPGATSGFDRRTFGIVVGAVGVAGLAAGAITGVLALGQHDELAKACPTGQCPESQRGAIDAYETMGTISTVGFIAGGVLAAAGVTLFLTAPSASGASKTVPPKAGGTPPKAGARIVPYATFGGAGIVGRF